jgi:hypothetical protein
MPILIHGDTERISLALAAETIATQRKFFEEQPWTVQLSQRAISFLSTYFLLLFDGLNLSVIKQCADQDIKLFFKKMLFLASGRRFLHETQLRHSNPNIEKLVHQYVCKGTGYRFLWGVKVENRKQVSFDH